MKKMLVVGDWLFDQKILEDGFQFLENDFQITVADKLPVEDMSYDLIVGWGSGCIDILSALTEIQTTALVLMSPYLDFDRFFSWCYDDPEWKSKCLERSQVKCKAYARTTVDLTLQQGRKVFLKEPSDMKNVYLFVSGDDDLIKAEDVLKMEFFFKNSSIHFIEGVGFAPFEEAPDTFQKIFNGFVIDENF